MNLTHKELLELKYWIEAPLLDQYEEGVLEDSRARQKAMQERYLEEWDLVTSAGGMRLQDIDPSGAVLEIGTGPYWGMLPHIDATLRVAIDPLIDAFYQTGILEERGDIRYFCQAFELWDPGDYLFDAVLCANALDHGEMGFNLLPKIARILKPGGRFYLHVQLRPADLLNLIHDHSLTVEQLDRHLSYTDLHEIWRTIYSADPVMGCDIPTLIGVWEKPQ